MNFGLIFRLQAGELRVPFRAQAVAINTTRTNLTRQYFNISTNLRHPSLISPKSKYLPSTSTKMSDQEREHALASFKSKLLESREWEAKLKALRIEIKGLQKDFDHTEDNIKALQSVGQIIGEVLKQLDDERC